MPWEGDWLETDHGGGWLEEKMCAALRGVQLHMQSGRDVTAGLAALDGEAASSRAPTYPVQGDSRRGGPGAAQSLLEGIFGTRDILLPMRLRMSLVHAESQLLSPFACVVILQDKGTVLRSPATGGSCGGQQQCQVHPNKGQLPQEHDTVCGCAPALPLPGN